MARGRKKKQPPAKVNDEPPAKPNADVETPAESPETPVTPVSRPQSIAESTHSSPKSRFGLTLRRSKDFSNQSVPESPTASSHSPGFMEKMWSLASVSKNKRDSAANAKTGSEESISRMDFAGAGRTDTVAGRTGDGHMADEKNSDSVEPSPTASQVTTGFSPGQEELEVTAFTEDSDVVPKFIKRAASGREAPSERHIPLPGPNRARAQSQKDTSERDRYKPSFKRETQSSIAKQQDKYPLDSMIKNPRAAVKEPPGTAGQRPTYSSGETGKRPEVRSKRSQKDLSRPGSSHKDRSRPGSSHGNVSRPGLSHSASGWSGPPTPVGYEGSSGNGGQSPDREPEVEEHGLMEESPSMPSDQEAPANVANGSARGEVSESESELAGKVDTSQALENGNVQDTLGPTMPSEETTDHDSRNKTRPRSAEETSKELTQAWGEESKGAREHAPQQADESPQWIKDPTKLKEGIEELTEVLRASYSGNSDEIPDTAALKVWQQHAADSNWGSEMSALSSAILQGIERFETRVAEDEQKHARAMNVSVAYAEISMPQAPTDNNRYSYRTRYEAELELRRNAEAETKKWKQKAEENYRPELERELKDLKIHLNTAMDERDRLVRKLAEQETNAQIWESDCKTAQKELEKRADGFEEELQGSQKELLAHGEEYRRKLEKVGNLDVVAWDRQISQLERRMEADGQKANAINETLQGKLDKLKMDNEIYAEQGQEWCSFLGKKARDYYTKDPGSKRESVIERKRKELKKRRALEELEDELIEKLMAYKMGKWYPPKNPKWKYNGKVARSSWERFDGKGWLGGLTDEDYGLYEELRERGSSVIA